MNEPGREGQGPFWIPVRAPGRLATLARPPGGASLEPYLLRLQERGLTAVVSLLEDDAEGEGPACARVGLEFLHHAIADFSVPTNAAAFWLLAERIRSKVGNGGHVAIHCGAGIGRSSLLAAAVLVLLGHPLEGVFATISDARGEPVPDTPEQRAWLLNTARHRGSSAGND